MSFSRALVASSFAIAISLISFSLGHYVTGRTTADRLVANEARIDALQAELASRRATAGNQTLRGLGGADRTLTSSEQVVLIEEIKRQLQTEMGLLPLQLLKDRRQSFVELYAYDARGKRTYGTAGYLGRGYFITVKHGVIALPQSEHDSRELFKITSIRIRHRGREIPATLVDYGNADAEVHPGDWAIIKIKERLNLPPLLVNLAYSWEFAEPIFRLGNDYSQGIILATGYLGQRTPNGLITCLTDGHPGVSGGGVLSQAGELVGIPIGRMAGDYRFSFILPLRREMFKKIPGVAGPEQLATEATIARGISGGTPETGGKANRAPTP